MSASPPSIDLRSAEEVGDLFDRAAEANRATSGRRGSAVRLGREGRLVISGDLHDQRENLEKIIRFARLERGQDHHLVVQEVIHGEHLVNGMDFSYRTLARIAELKVRHPGQVHHILSNHELSQARGDSIIKERGDDIAAFSEGLGYVFGDGADRVANAIGNYVRQLPLAVITGAGVMCAHSLPSARKLGRFETDILERELTEADLTGPEGSAYLMIWGRGLEETAARQLRQAWGVKQFVLGHQPAEMGWEEYGSNILVINSDHARGVALPLDLSREYQQAELIDRLVALAGLPSL